MGRRERLLQTLTNVGVYRPRSYLDRFLTEADIFESCGYGGFDDFLACLETAIIDRTTRARELVEVLAQTLPVSFVSK